MRKRTRKRLALLIAVAAMFAVTGCAAGMGEARKPIPSFAEVETKMRDDLGSIPPVQKIKLPANAFVVTSKAGGIPPELDKEIDASFSEASIAQVLQTISKATGINSFYSDAASFSPAIGQESSSASAISIIPPASPMLTGQGGTYSPQQPKSDNITLSFKGKLSDFLNTVSRATGWIFSYDSAALCVKKNETYSVIVPAYPELLKEIERNVAALGGRSIAYDRLTSALTFQADSNAAQRISEFCRKARDNASLVTMRIMLVNVRLDGSASAGIDWTKFVLGYGTQKQVGDFGNRTMTSASGSGSSGSPGSGPTGSGSGADAGSTPFPNVLAPVNGLSDGLGAVFSATGANIFIDATKFTLGALLNFIESYGRFSSIQNAFIESLSGTKSALHVLTETPYVSEISLSALSTNAATATQSVKTATAKSGVELEVVPYYSSREGTLSLALKVNVSNVTRFLTLSAGNQIGSITQPETILKTVDTYLRMTPSQVAVIGGLSLESHTDSSYGLPADTWLTKTASSATAKEELVIIVKPAVIEFEAA